MKYVRRREGAAFFRRRVPKGLANRFFRGELVYSLGFGSAAQIRERSHLCWLRSECVFVFARENVTVTREDLQHLADTYIAGVTQKDRAAGHIQLESPSIGRKAEIKFREDFARYLIDADYRREPVLDTGEIRALANQIGISLDSVDDGPLPSASEMRRAAIHEIGHAIAILHYGGTVESIVLNPGGSIGGRVREQSRQTSLLTKADLISQCVVLLAGRAAEDALLGAPSSGSGGTTRSDLARATALVTAMHRSLGLGNDLVYSEHALMDEPGWLPPDLHRRVADDLAAAYDHALDIVRANRLRIELVADRLIESSFLSGSDLEAFLAHLDVGNQ